MHLKLNVRLAVWPCGLPGFIRRASCCYIWNFVVNDKQCEDIFEPCNFSCNQYLPQRRKTGHIKSGLWIWQNIIKVEIGFSPKRKAYALLSPYAVGVDSFSTEEELLILPRPCNVQFICPLSYYQPKIKEYYDISTGWPFSLCKTSSWHWFESCTLV